MQREWSSPVYDRSRNDYRDCWRYWKKKQIIYLFPAQTHRHIDALNTALVYRRHYNGALFWWWEVLFRWRSCRRKHFSILSRYENDWWKNLSHRKTASVLAEQGRWVSKTAFVEVRLYLEKEDFGCFLLHVSWKIML